MDESIFKQVEFNSLNLKAIRGIISVSCLLNIFEDHIYKVEFKPFSSIIRLFLGRKHEYITFRIERFNDIITLEDVLYNIRLPMDGNPVTKKNVKSNDICRNLLGHRVTHEKGFLRLIDLRNAYKIVHNLLN